MCSYVMCVWRKRECVYVCGVCVCVCSYVMFMWRECVHILCMWSERMCLSICCVCGESVIIYCVCGERERECVFIYYACVWREKVCVYVLCGYCSLYFPLSSTPDISPARPVMEYMVSELSTPKNTCETGVNCNMVPGAYARSTTSLWPPGKHTHSNMSGQAPMTTMKPVNLFASTTTGTYIYII